MSEASDGSEKKGSIIKKTDDAVFRIEGREYLVKFVSFYNDRMIRYNIDRREELATEPEDAAIILASIAVSICEFEKLDFDKVLEKSRNLLQFGETRQFPTRPRESLH